MNPLSVVASCAAMSSAEKPDTAFTLHHLQHVMSWAESRKAAWCHCTHRLCLCISGPPETTEGPTLYNHWTIIPSVVTIAPHSFVFAGRCQGLTGPCEARLSAACKDRAQGPAVYPAEHGCSKGRCHARTALSLSCTPCIQQPPKTAPTPHNMLTIEVVQFRYEDMLNLPKHTSISRPYQRLRALARKTSSPVVLVAPTCTDDRFTHLSAGHCQRRSIEQDWHSCCKGIHARQSCIPGIVYCYERWKKRRLHSLLETATLWYLEHVCTVLTMLNTPHS